MGSPAPVLSPAAPQRRRGARLLLLAALAAAAAVAGGSGAWLWLTRGPATTRPATEAPTYWSTRPVVVNVADRRFLRATVEFAVSRTDAARLEERRAAVLDAVLAVLGATPAETLVDPARRDSLRRAIAERVNAVLGTPAIREVYFTEFVVQ